MDSSGEREWPFVLNLANSILGVSVLAMPYCFMRCGILLGTILLLLSSYLTTLSCELLMKAAIASKRKSYEFLAQHVLGGSGKLLVEIGITGTQLGICIAFHVIIGDLGPSLIAKWTGFENTDVLRMSLMTISAFTISLPLSLMRQLDSITRLSVLSIGFYGIVVLSVFLTSWPKFFSLEWIDSVDYWSYENVFQCLPIFAMAFGCQTQMFLLYENLPEPSLSVLKRITSGGVQLCMLAYLITGFFGYIAFYDSELLGDVLLNFTPSFYSDLLKFGFVVSVALSFPLMVFPCRQSLNTLLFSSSSQSLHGHSAFTGPTPIPPSKFNTLTAVIILGTLAIAINFPNVEFILGLNGSTMGCMICFIFPALLFLKVKESRSEGSMKAKAVFVTGIIVLCLSTYTTLQQAEHQRPPVIQVTEPLALITDKPTMQPVPDISLAAVAGAAAPAVLADKNPRDANKQDEDGPIADDAAEKTNEEKVSEEERKEPPNPQPPDDSRTEPALPSKDKDQQANEAGDAEAEPEPEPDSKEEVKDQRGKDKQGSNQKEDDGKNVKDENVDRDHHHDESHDHESHAEIKQLIAKVDNIQNQLVEQNKLIEGIKKNSKRDVEDGPREAVVTQQQQQNNQPEQPKNQRPDAAVIRLPEYQQNVPQQQPAVQQFVQQPAAQPIAQQPVAQQPAAQPIIQQPAAQPVAQQPQPVAQQPAAQPIIQQPAVQPMLQEPAAQPIAQQPAAKPIIQQPAAQPVVQQPAAQAIVQQPAAQPIAQQPAAQPIVQQPIVQQPPAQPIAQQPAAQPVVQQPAAQPIVQQPPAQPIVQQPAAQPFVQTPAAQPIVQQPAAQQIAQQPAAQPAAQQSPAQPVAQQPAAQPVVQQPASQPFVQHPNVQQPVAQAVVPQNLQNVQQQQDLLPQQQGNQHSPQNAPQPQYQQPEQPAQQQVQQQPVQQQQQLQQSVPQYGVQNKIPEANMVHRKTLSAKGEQPEEKQMKKSIEQQQEILKQLEKGAESMKKSLKSILESVNDVEQLKPSNDDQGSETRDGERRGIKGNKGASQNTDSKMENTEDGGYSNDPGKDTLKEVKNHESTMSPVSHKSKDDKPLTTAKSLLVKEEV